MKGSANNSFVRTIKERCRLCYTCVRECPAKAIRVISGQAEIIGERCINCGNCVRVCSQKAKQVVNTTDEVRKYLKSESKVAALLAPSFPAEFVDIAPKKLVSALRTMGFDWVFEVAFGADLVAREYGRLLAEARVNGRQYISTPCPAVITFVEKYQPEIVDALAPVVSPMIATARVAKSICGGDIKTVFIGPCIAKKQEATSLLVAGDVDCVITFGELRELIDECDLDIDKLEDSDFDWPQGGPGALFPLSRGLLQAANIREDLLAGDVVTAEGRTNFVEAIKEFAEGSLNTHLLEILACTGCIAGAGVTNSLPLFARRAKVSEYVREKMRDFDHARWRMYMEEFSDLDLRRTFVADDHRIPLPSEQELRKILNRMGKYSPEDELNCGACGYETCREHAIAIYKGLAESEMCLPYTIEQLKKTIDELANTKEMLIQTEKLASMGQLAAGIAHEINNPLGVVLMFAHLLMERVEKDSQMYEDLKLIVEQADRCKKIVSGLLHFARQNKINPEPTDLVELTKGVVRSLTVPDNVKVAIVSTTDDTTAEVDKDQIAQVMTNLVSNAISAIEGRGMVRIELGSEDDYIVINVIDTGRGIPKEHLGRIFEPFFTTKQAGEGTGLGLAITYGIVKMHYGDIKVESNADPRLGPTGTKFTIKLPKKASAGKMFKGVL